MENGNAVRDSNTIRNFFLDSVTKEVDIKWGKPTPCHLDGEKEQVWLLADNGRYLNEAFKQNWEFGEKNIHFEEGGYIVDIDTDMVLTFKCSRRREKRLNCWILWQAGRNQMG